MHIGDVIIECTYVSHSHKILQKAEYSDYLLNRLSLLVGPLWDDVKGKESF